jgi:hypothetical protein
LNILTFADTIESLSTNTASLLSFLIEIEDRYPKPVPRVPGLLRSILRRPKHTPVDALHSPPTLPMALSPEEEESQITGAVPPKDDTAIASLPLVSRATRKRPKLLAWLASPQTIYAFRVAFLSIALYSLGLCKKTASTYFSYGGFVSTILAQVCLFLFLHETLVIFTNQDLIFEQSYVGIYAGDQVHSS